MNSSLPTPAFYRYTNANANNNNNNNNNGFSPVKLS